ncbi:Pr6Pr family membrane protein [Streptomyces fumanus]|uniref:Integral membrane regulator n=1 Tax=Streptomyces fumanus TaxID=67302 RepID=A0A919DXK7_9ACTN|nr:Pr6Pr family membrane protein [Streptomyces fumanus]GHE88258.1 integral membrane regulator [Streptomyces fumanus]
MTAPIPRDIPDLPAVPGPPALLPAPVPATAVLPRVRRPATAVFRLLTALLAITGIALELAMGSAPRALSYFTLQSTIILAAVLTLSARSAWTARRPLPPAVTGAALLYTVTAALAHHALLTNPASPFAVTSTPTGWHALAGHLLHTAVPLAVVADWLLLTPPGRLRLRHTAAWLAYPLAYLAFSLTRGELLHPGTPARYPYPFLDVDAHGYRSVLGNALLLGLAVYAVAALLVAADRVRPNPLRRLL